MRVPFFSPKPPRRFSAFDLLLYRLFYWRWSRHLADYPDLREAFLQQLAGFHAQRQRPLGCLHPVETPRSGKTPPDAAT